MIELRNNNNDLISNIISSLSPLMSEKILIENNLLDGTRHKQLIGEPRYYYTFDLVCNGVEESLLKNAVDRVEVCTFNIGDEDYIGFIKTDKGEKLTKNYSDKSKVHYLYRDIKFEIIGGIE